MALSEKRKADRAQMVKKLVAIVAECGATYDVRPEGFDSYSPRRVLIGINGARGLGCGIDFDGQSVQPNIFVNGWNIGTKSDACLVDDFPDGEINPFHFRKCTTVVYGFDALCEHVREVLTRAQSGELFHPEREAAGVAERGTWQERQARLAAFFSA